MTLEVKRVALVSTILRRFASFWGARQANKVISWLRVPSRPAGREVESMKAANFQRRGLAPAFGAKKLTN